ncbi:MAG: OB-fold-containig protein, partial [Asticcacaulis sp.]
DEHGQAHYVMVEPDNPSDILPEGTGVLLVRCVGAKYYAILNPSASLSDASV